MASGIVTLASVHNLVCLLGMPGCLDFLFADGFLQVYSHPFQGRECLCAASMCPHGILGCSTRLGAILPLTGCAEILTPWGVY